MLKVRVQSVSNCARSYIQKKEEKKKNGYANITNLMSLYNFIILIASISKKFELERSHEMIDRSNRRSMDRRVVDRAKERRVVQLVKWRVPNAVLMWVKVIAKKKWQRNIQHYAHKWAKHYMRRGNGIDIGRLFKR